MQKYLNLIKKILKDGKQKNDRTGTGTLSIFGYHMRLNLKLGFPLITTKKCYIPAIIHELLWFLNGHTNIKYLNKNNISIWDKWANKKGDLGPIYGKQWRNWQSYNRKKNIDQIKNVLHIIKNDPNSRRMIISSWNPVDIDKMALPPCHILFQFYILDNTLSCQIYQRSCDVFLGLPFNLASYAILMHMIAQQCNLKIGDLLWTGGDVHLYNNHIKPANIQILRKPKKKPVLVILNKPNSLFEYNVKDFHFTGYDPHPVIKAEVSV